MDANISPDQNRDPVKKDIASKQRIVIAEDHTILREGLKAMLTSRSEYEVVCEAQDGREAIRCAERFKPNLMLMDLSMPRMNGLDAIREVKKRSPKTKVLVLTVHNTEEYIQASLQAGADGYVLKDSTHGELELAIRNVLSGKYFVSPAISEKIIGAYLKRTRPVKRATGWENLTSRERGILKLVAEGYKNKEIGDYLCISVKTVEKHRANLMRKLNLHNISELTAFAVEKGLVTR